MELRRLAVLMAFALLAVSQCAETRHSIQRRDAEADISTDVGDDAGDMFSELGDDPSSDSEFDAQNATQSEAGPTPAPEVPAVILTAPSYINEPVGKTIVLPCNVTPDATVVQWYKDNVSYFIGSWPTGTNDSRYSIVPNSKDMKIENVNVLDSGVYRCETLQKTSVAINHTVIVLEPPKITSFEASNGGRASEGSDVLLTCKVTGSPKPNIVWSRFTEGDANVRLTEKDGEFFPDSVLIKNIKLEQAGKYLCYVFNTAGQTQGTVEVLVFAKPRVHVHKTIVNSDVNVEALLQCSTHGDTKPRIHWYKDGRLIEDSSSQFKISSSWSHSNLTVIPRVSEDFGTFTCEAQNEHGKHSGSIDLVQSPVIEDLIADGPKLSWTIHSYQPLEAIEVQLKNFNGVIMQYNVPVPETSAHSQEFVFTLADKQLEAAKYEAYVRAKNNNSWSANSNSVLIDIEAQQIIQHASVYRGNGNNAYSIRPTTTAVLSTILMYLLVRML